MADAQREDRGAPCHLLGGGITAASPQQIKDPLLLATVDTAVGQEDNLWFRAAVEWTRKSAKYGDWWGGNMWQGECLEGYLQISAIIKNGSDPSPLCRPPGPL